MQVRFGINLGSRDAQKLGLDYTKCTKGSVHNFSDAEIKAIRDRVGEFSVVAADKRSEPSDTDLEKLTAPDKKK